MSLADGSAYEKEFGLPEYCKHKIAVGACIACKEEDERKRAKFIGLPKDVPPTEFSEFFVQAMANRMGMSFFKYGPAPEAYPTKIDAIATAKEKIELYLEGGFAKNGDRIEPGNTEYLIDAANYLMLEFMYPLNLRAFFKATDSAGSTGRTWLNGVQSDAGHGERQRNEAVKQFYSKFKGGNHG